MRRCWATDDPAVLAGLDPERAWPGLRSVAAVEGERRRGDQISRETRYYLTSLPAEARTIAEAVRGHWGIENRLHWVLDVACRDDESRVRVGHAAENFAVLRHLALNRLRQERTAKSGPPRADRQERTAKSGVKAKRLKAAWDDAYRRKVLAS